MSYFSCLGRFFFNLGSFLTMSRFTLQSLNAFECICNPLDIAWSYIPQGTVEGKTNLPLPHIRKPYLRPVVVPLLFKQDETLSMIRLSLCGLTIWGNNFSKIPQFIACKVMHLAPSFVEAPFEHACVSFSMSASFFD